MSAGRPAVLLDAFGTLVELEPPTPRLAGLLAAAGHPFPEDAVARALAAEMRHYRAHHDRGRDAASLAALRRECGAVLAAALGPGAPAPEAATGLLMESLRFRPSPDAHAALDALRAGGARIGVVSNWDADLPRVLGEAGVLERVDAVAVSALVGSAKPHPAIFLHALAALGARPAEALHCGDRLDTDCAGARAAGVRPVLLDRDGRHPDAACTRVRGLMEIPALLATAL